MNQNFKTQVENILSNPSYNEEDIYFHLKKLMFEKELRNTQIKPSSKISDLIAENIKYTLNPSLQNSTIKTGFDDFDHSFGGFELGEMVVIGARPTMGKTQLLVNLSLNISKTIPILFFTFGISAQHLTRRFCSSISNISIHQMLHNELNEAEKEKLTSVTSQIEAHHIFINESGHQSVSALKTICREHVKEHGVKVVFIDYLQIMSSPKFRNNRETEISYIVRELKNLAKELNICIIISSQLSRAVESRYSTKIPQLSDLRDSGAIEQDADKVIFIYRPEFYNIPFDDKSLSNAGITQLIVAKNKNGTLGMIQLMRDADHINFHNFVESKEEFSFSPSRLKELTNLKSNPFNSEDSDF